ncbi:hypothetical protein TRM7557_02684 [Tritonibacter multivorans]|uniref:Uncharacterized protein n=1 Tax=Tritonibacter multivorans TaxID=928856 RepID=A0A0P1GX15_9RHOB|nr:DUF6478 family protein [Tritonibacter multivorans]MDA7420260.1 DUF6478 family protein [Tritonibacter multivorans]CUH79983.1 hypothetical protein TRM7557_02684 [Tritonibacter multivorans]SFB97980.1 hypothetical protein SAMN04488049_10134 [Tritonibacter multivorans]
MGSFLDRLVHTTALRRWRRDTALADRTPLHRLRSQRNQARKLRQHLSELIHRADGKLAMPHIGSDRFSRPHGTDWSWRPEPWRGPLPVAGVAAVPSKARLGHEVQLFHDCRISELTLRQLRNTREEDLAPFGLRMDVFQFDGSFLSLVLDLPSAALEGLGRQHVIRVDAIVERERPLEIFARLNLQHGPNTVQIVQELPQSQTSVSAEFDLAHSDMNEKRLEKAWVDLIFEAPDMNQVIIRDITFARYLRATF